MRKTAMVRSKDSHTQLSAKKQLIHKMKMTRHEGHELKGSQCSSCLLSKQGARDSHCKFVSYSG